jgi:hypothetical protein
MQGPGDLNTLNIEELLQRLKRKGVPLQFEIGAFVALETCEAIVDSPVQTSLEVVWVNEQGQVTVAEEAPPSSDEKQAVRSLLDLLSDLLLASAPGVPEDLLRLVDPGPEASDRTLKQLRDELEASLVPLNRQATRRVLARLVREATLQQDRPSARPMAKSKQSDLDASFDELVGYDPPDVGETAAGERAKEAWRGDSAPSGSRPPGTPVPEAEADEEEAGPPVAEHHRESMERFVEADRAPVRLPRTVVVAVLVLAALVLGYFMLKDFARGSFGLGGSDRPSGSLAAPADQRPSALQPPPGEKERPVVDKPRGGRLTVNSSPQGAQVLLFTGTAPLTIAGIPLRMAHEFVAVAEGRKPVRALLPADAAWQDTSAGPRYELLLKSVEATGPGSEWKLGPTRLPRDPGSPSGKLGTVRVRTDPGGMQVYRLLGFTPDLKIDNLPVGETALLVIYESGYSVAKVTVEPDSWVTAGDGLKAEIDITLEKE